MDNPAIKDFDKCNCPADKAMIEKCHDNDPRWVKVYVPYSQSAILFSRKSVIVSTGTGNCNDQCGDNSCPPNKYIVPPTTPCVVLSGYGIYEDELCSSKCDFKHLTVSVAPDNAEVSGTQYSDTDTLFAAIKDLVADCNCNC